MSGGAVPRSRVAVEALELTEERSLPDAAEEA